MEQGDDEPAGHHDGRHTQLPPSVPAVHTVQLRQGEEHIHKGEGGDGRRAVLILVRYKKKETFYNYLYSSNLIPTLQRKNSN